MKHILLGVTEGLERPWVTLDLVDLVHYSGGNIPNNEIRYTTSDNLPVEPNNPSNITGSVINVVSNIYSPSRGYCRMIFDGDIHSLGYQSLFNSDKVTSIYLPASITGIDSSAIRCPNLMKIEIDKNNHVYDSRDNCNAIIKTSTNELILGSNGTIIPNTVVSIGMNSFANLNFISSIDVPSGVKNIYSRAFANCKNLTSLTISDTVTNCYSTCVSDCPELSTLVVDSNNTVYRSENNTMYKGTTLWIGSKTSTISETTTLIDSYAFEGRNITSISIPDSVTRIANGAFKNTNLTSLEIPEGTQLDGSSFTNCQNLSSINIAANCSIKADAFEDCYIENLEDLVIADSSMQYYPFGLRTNFALGFDESASGFDMDTVYYRTLSGDMLSNGLAAELIGDLGEMMGEGDWYFYTSSYWDDAAKAWGISYDGWRSLSKTLYIPYSTPLEIFIPKEYTLDFSSTSSELLGVQVSSQHSTYRHEENYNAVIEDNCLMAISNVAVLPEIITRHDTSAFIPGKYLKTLNIPSSFTNINSQSLSHLSRLESISVAEGNTKYDSRNNCNALIETETNTLIKSCKNTVIPNSVTSIGDYAYSGLSWLSSMIIPDLIISLGNFVFWNCTNLNSVYFGSSFETLGNNVFLNCTNLSNFEVASNNNYYRSSNSILYAKDLTSIVLVPPAIPGKVTLPNGLISLGDSAFSSCTKITEVYIPNSVTSVSNKCFSGCSLLVKVTLSRNLTSISDRTFYNCYKLTSVNIPTSITSIGEYAFYGCQSLETINIPNSVMDIGKYAFYNCYRLETINLPSGITVLNDHIFYGCDKLTSIVIPDSVTSIGESAFYSCDNLETVNIPSKITTIPKDAFYYCKNLNIIIPTTVTKIDNTAFAYAEGNIYMMSSIPPTLGSYVFGYSSFNGTIYVYNVSAYQKASGWSSYKSSIKPMPIENLLYKSIKSISALDVSGTATTTKVTVTYLADGLDIILNLPLVDYEIVEEFTSSDFGRNETDEPRLITITITEHGLTGTTTITLDIIHPSDLILGDNLIDNSDTSKEEYSPTSSRKGRKYSFIPNTSGSVRFAFDDSDYTDADTYGYLYDSSMKLLTSNDDSNGNMDPLFTYNCTAGETYYVVITRYSGTDNVKGILTIS